MRGTPPIQRRPVTDALRASIVEDLPEINDIKDAELRAKVIEGWAFSLAGSSTSASATCRAKAIRTCWCSSAATSRRTCAASRIRDEDGRGVRDLASGDPHRPRHRARRRALPRHRQALRIRSGEPQALGRGPLARRRPCLRHSVYGAHVCLSVGLPEEIAHIALGHSLEGQHIGLSTECYIVRHADHTWWTSRARSACSSPRHWSMSAR